MGEIMLEVARGLWRKHAIAFPKVLGAVHGPGRVHGQLKPLAAGSSTLWGQRAHDPCMAPCMAGHVIAETPVLVTGAFNHSPASTLRLLALAVNLFAEQDRGASVKLRDRRPKTLAGAIRMLVIVKRRRVFAISNIAGLFSAHVRPLEIQIWARC